jgi:hypothetical protein
MPVGSEGVDEGAAHHARSRCGGQEEGECGREEEG